MRDLRQPPAPTRNPAPPAVARATPAPAAKPKADRCYGGMSPPCAVCVCGDAGDLDDTTLSWR